MKESRHHYHRPEKTQRIQNEQNKQQQIEQPTGTQQTKSITWSRLRTSKTEKKKKNRDATLIAKQTSGENYKFPPQTSVL
jgi:hypothetical protein